MWPYETGACRCLLMSQVNKAEILINRWFCVTEIGNGSKLKEVSIVLAVDYFLDFGILTDTSTDVVVQSCVGKAQVIFVALSTETVRRCLHH